MKLLSRFIRGNLQELHDKNVKIRATGRLQDLPRGPLKDLQEAMEHTAGNTGLTLVLALSYGGRAEIRDAVAAIAEKVQAGEVSPDGITEATIASHLYNPDIPDPELIIRTSGEQRLSNFLMWQSAYSEFFFSPVLWPDFSRDELNRAIQDYCSRGGVSEGWRTRWPFRNFLEEPSSQFPGSFCSLGYSFTHHRCGASSYLRPGCFRRLGGCSAVLFQRCEPPHKDTRILYRRCGDPSYRR